MYPDSAREKFIVPIGPQHPALKEPGHFEFAVEGEVVTSATVRLGYVHRGLEKAAESNNWVQDLYLLERVCGICSHNHATAYCLAVEQLAGVQAPPRAQAIRVLFSELERIASHFLWLGVAAHEGGFESLFMYTWRDRETIMDLVERLSGNRVHYSVNVLGGVKCDPGPADIDTVRSGVDYLEERTLHYRDLVTRDFSFQQRTRGIAVASAETARRLGLIGPTARASGIASDVRVDAPYAGYADFPARIVTGVAGDLEARFIVRLEELLDSYRLIRDVMDRLPAGDLTARMPRKIKAGEAISRVEAPRGELFYFVKSNGGDHPERVHVRTPTICNLASVLTLAVGHKLADVPMILAGIDPCFSCNDRMVTVRRGADGQTWSWSHLLAYSREYYQARS